MKNFWLCAPYPRSAPHLTSWLIIAFLAITAQFVVFPSAAGSKQTSVEYLKKAVHRGDWHLAFLNAVSLPTSELPAYIKWAEPRAGEIPASMLVVLANALREMDIKTALRWHTKARLRLRVNLSVCKNQKEAWGGNYVLDNFAEKLIRYRLMQPKLAIAATREALKWDDAHMKSYRSRKWDCMIAINMLKAASRKPMLKSAPALVPRKERADIRQKARQAFLERQIKLTSMMSN